MMFSFLWSLGAPICSLGASLTFPTSRLASGAPVLQGLRPFRVDIMHVDRPESRDYVLYKSTPSELGVAIMVG